MTEFEDWVRGHEGDFVIRRILIASNGLAAVKGIRSIRKWAYEELGDERIFKFIVMATRDDIEANAEFIKLSDDYIEVPGGPNHFNYANVDLIISLANQYSVQAVWAGWGHASENPRLPAGLAALEPKIAFIGPSSGSMRALGDKISSIIVAQTAQVETVPWSGTGITFNVNGDGSVIIDEELYRSACCQTVEDGLEAAKRIGLPVMIKASEGGGGKGIRRVDMMDQFGKLFKIVQNEVPGSPIFIMKVAENARHLEVQLMSDLHGNATVLYGRDCSVQRRHQKIIEEAPITVAPPEVSLELELAALRLAKLVGYQNVGTVEYLYDIDSRTYCFLELNPRLQVEHPTSEMVSGVNIPACQLMIAMGIPLHRISFIRKFYQQEEGGSSRFDLDLANRRPPIGHVVATRITAENPADGFKPNGGKLRKINFSPYNGTWGYFAVYADGHIHDYSDSQFGHVFAQGADRAQACKYIVETLGNILISSEFRTNLGYVRALVENPAFQSNAFSTAWLDGLIQSKFSPYTTDDPRVAMCAAIVLASKTFKLRQNIVIDSLKKHHYPTKNDLSCSTICKFIFNSVSYEFEAFLQSEEAFEVRFKEEIVPVKISKSCDNMLLISFGEKNHLVQSQDNEHNLYLIVDGVDCLIEFENDPTSVRAPSSGRIVKFLVEEGSHVERDMAIVEIEVMKMYLPVAAQGAGQISFKRQIGSSIQAGDLIASIDLDDKDCKLQLAQFSGSIASLLATEESFDVFEKYKTALKCIGQVSKGFHCSAYKTITEDLIQCLADPLLPFYKLASTVASLRCKLPGKLVSDLTSIAEKGLTSGELKYLLDADMLISSNDDPVIDSIHQTIKPHLDGPMNFSMSILIDLIKGFIECEVFFSTELTLDGPLNRLLEAFNGEVSLVADFIRRHYRLETQIDCLLSLIDQLVLVFPQASKRADFVHVLRSLAGFSGKEYGRLSRRIREVLLVSQIPSLDELFQKIELKFESAIKLAEHSARRAEFIDEMVQGFTTHLDVIPRFFHHPNEHIRKMALEIYTKRAFAAYLITETEFSEDGDLFEWSFNTQPKEDGVLDGEGHHKRRPSTSTVYPLVGISGAESWGKMGQKRRGYMVAVDDINRLGDSIRKSLKRMSQRSDEEPNHLYLVAKEQPEWNDDQTGAFVQKAILGLADELRLHRVRRITLALVRSKVVSVGFYTFSESRDYQEDLTIRHIEPAMAYLLEFPRLCNYDIEFCHADVTGQVRIYLGTEKSKARHQRLFIRLIIRPNQAMREFTSMIHFAPEANRILEEVLQAVEAVQARLRQPFDYNHLFINIVPVFYNQPSDVQVVLQHLEGHYKQRWSELRIRQAEIRFSLAPSKDSPSCRYRFYLDNTSGHVSKIYGYKECKDPVSGFKYLSSISSPAGRLDGFPVTFHYPLLTSLQVKQSKINSLDTPYVYDFPQIFEQAIETSWKRYHALGGDIPGPSKYLESTELVWEERTARLVPTTRNPGLNNIGMVAWRFRLFTPEAPTGRDIIVISNDMSLEIGSFGVDEDRLFKEASQLARQEGIPRIYLSGNSGARIGLADELKNLIQVAWLNSENPSAGFEYLYLEESDYEALKPSVVNCERIFLEDGHVRYKIVDIIGSKHGLGVENLQGSALIAGETSKAYDEIFTLSLVTCRSVGIGAYLVRLGQRVIQKKQHPIILTGVGALNSLLGREVYQNNLQIGGPQIMFNNGVTHRVVNDDLEGAQEIIDWLAFVPLSTKNPVPPILRTRDNPLRPVSFVPPASDPYDPRALIEGRVVEGVWQSGLFDRGSFIEVLGGWAKTVVTGRARLGGYPVGIVAVETRTVESVIPADPANLNSTAQTVKQAGQVWFPDSAYKTAQAIRDFTKGEHLPIFILANWRGFSGGQRDLYEQIMKFGAMIVDALTNVQQPVFVYMPPGAELRGGAWVVVDSKINSDHIEMYADPSARGGVLEPEGIVGVKFRPQHLNALMDRLDPTCASLSEAIEAASTPSAKEELSKKLAARRAKLLPVFRQVACQFAGYHDTPGRMKAKNVIREIVPWTSSRAFFYHRLRRILSITELVHLLKGSRLTVAQKREKLGDLLLSRFAIDIDHDSDEAVFDKLAEHMVDIKAAIRHLNVSIAKAEISMIISELSSDLSIEIGEFN